MTPIDEYALIGDTRTAALTSPDGSIDWLCLPRFDGFPVFGALVGGPEAGRFAITPAAPTGPARRRYDGHSTVVVTTWPVSGGEVELTEGMVAGVSGSLLPQLLLVRRVVARGAPAAVTVTFDPRLGWDRRVPRWRRSGAALVATAGAHAVALHTAPVLDVVPGTALTMTIDPARPLTLALVAASREPLVHVDALDAWRLLQADARAWRSWAGRLAPTGPFHETVVRSLLTLRQLTYSPSGAPVAAPTTSLPESPGGDRNWDYRYSWPRDASLGVSAFLGVGDDEEAARFFTWLVHATALDRPRIPVMLTVYGTRAPAERTLPGWPGYAGSTPVRVGNDARDQHQLDGYGWPLDAAAELAGRGHPLDGPTWRALASFADYAAAHWRAPDSGIWEIRGEPRHYVHSKLMAWVAVDRALRLAPGHRAGTRRVARWTRARAELHDFVATRGYDAARGRYARAAGAPDLDAALLLLPRAGFEPVDSPRVARTVAAIQSELAAGGPFLYRYAPGSDGLAGTEGAFLPCSFWLVEALARLGRVGEATALMERLVAIGGPLGLFGEEADPVTGRQRGNYPQALTHAALVGAAVALAAATPGPAEATAPPRTRRARPS